SRLPEFVIQLIQKLLFSVIHKNLKKSALPGTMSTRLHKISECERSYPDVRAIPRSGESFRINSLRQGGITHLHSQRKRTVFFVPVWDRPKNPGRLFERIELCSILI
ncbi:hypothetical protein WI617_02530, partial [Salmonella enterica subsp. enterica serovar Corvallis]